MKLILFFFRSYFTVLSFVSPRLAAKRGFQLFQKTSNKRFKSRELDFYAKTDTFTVASQVGEINCYEMGNPDGEIVFLVHGWNSNAGSMAGIGANLIDNGYHVISFDLPGHGKSVLKKTNLLECKIAMQAVLKHFATGKPINIVSHSFGSLVTSYTLSASKPAVNTLVYLTTPNEVTAIFSEFKETVRLGSHAYEYMVAHAEGLLQEKLTDFSALNKLQSVNYSKLTLIHDLHDKMLPFENSKLISERLPRTELHVFEKIGHYRMLWNDKVLIKVSEALEIV